MQAKRHAVDLCNGPLFSKIIVFFIPVMLSNILQMVYNAADQMIVGKFAGPTDLAAVGSTTSLVSLIICTIVGLSVGVSSVTARHFGAGNKTSLSRTIHTAVALGLIVGVILAIVGILCAKRLLMLMGSPDDVLPKATLYMQILFLGLPHVAVFNFTSAILRAVGDTKRPMIFMIISGVLNVLMNLLFVICFDMAVAGVALATVISQFISAALTVRCLIATNEDYKLSLKNVKIHRNEFRQIVQIGVPSSIQSASFALSNVLIQSSINSFGSAAMAGCAASSTVENLVYQADNALYLTILSFVGQNYGAGKKDRIIKSVLYCIAIVTVMGLTIGILCAIFGEALLNLFMDKSVDPEFYEKAMYYGLQRLRRIVPVYFLCGIMEIGTGALRALNKSGISMVISLIGACGLRVVWIYTIFAANPSIPVLFTSYPVTWILTAICLYAVFIYYMRKLKCKNM